MGLFSITRGLIAVSSNDTYYLHPVGTPEPNHHLIHRAEHLHIPGGTCAHGSDFGNTIDDITRLFQLVDRRVQPALGLCLWWAGGLRAGLSASLLGVLGGQRVWLEFRQETSKGSPRTLGLGL